MSVPDEVPKGVRGLSLIYGRWTPEELEKRRANVFDPFQQDSRWYRIKELVVGPLGANYQAEEVPEPAQSAQANPPVEKQIVIPEPIRRWARRKGLLPHSLKNGPAYLPREIRDAYREEYGSEVLAEMLRNESLDARRLYAEEGHVASGSMYKQPSKLAQKTLAPEEIQASYRDVPKSVSEARVKARDSTTGGREEKREVARAAAKQITDPVVEERTKSLTKRTD